MLRKSCKLSAVFLGALVFAVCQLETVVLAGLAPSGTRILIVDGIGDGDTTVTPDIVNPIPGFKFGQLIGGNFSEIIANTTAINGGALVDFAIQNITNTSQVFSLTNPGTGLTTVTASLTGPSLAGSEQVPAVVGDYYNTLTLQWTVFGTLFNIQVLNAGAGASGNDGFAAVPLPPAVLLFGTGLIGLIGIARRSFFVS